MSMNVQHNLGAMNAQRNMSIAGAKNAKAMEKLSTGFRINRAADDAAGLAISEKMRSQVRGLNQASRNANDGISLIQTAEGALSTTHEALQRMQTLSTQAASGTYTEADKKKAQDEVNNLKAEIDRIADTTEFNTMKLLNGDLKETGKGLITGVANSGTVLNASKAVFATRTGSVAPYTGTGSITVSGELKAIITSGEFVSATITMTINGVSLEADLTQARNFSALRGLASGVAGEDGAFATDVFIKQLQDTLNEVLKKSDPATEDVILSIDNQGKLNMTSKSGNTDIKSTGIAAGILGKLGIAPGSSTTPATAYADRDIQINQGLKLTINGKAISLDLSTVSNISTGNTASHFVDQIKAVIVSAIGSAMTIQGLSAGKEGFIDKNQVDVTVDPKTGKLGIFFSEKSANLDVQLSGTFADQFGISGEIKTQKQDGYPSTGMTLHVGANENQIINFSIADMHTDALGLKDINITNGASAEKALTTVQNAINKVSDERSKMGAVQNRLEYTITNLDTTSENLQSSEARVRDADMAFEVMNQTQSNVLQQAAQAMLAQANQKPQSVLQLLG